MKRMKGKEVNMKSMSKDTKFMIAILVIFLSLSGYAFPMAIWCSRVKAHDMYEAEITRIEVTNNSLGHPATMWTYAIDHDRHKALTFRGYYGEPGMRMTYYVECTNGGHCKVRGSRNHNRTTNP